MFNKTHLTSLILVTTSILFFYSSYYYLHDLKFHDIKYAEVLGTITSSINLEKPPAEPTLINPVYSFSEETAIFVTFIISILISLTAFFLMIREQKLNGKTNYSLAIMFASIAVISCIVITIYKTGIYIYV